MPSKLASDMDFVQSKPRQEQNARAARLFGIDPDRFPMAGVLRKRKGNGSMASASNAGKSQSQRSNSNNNATQGQGKGGVGRFLGSGGEGRLDEGASKEHRGRMARRRSVGDVNGSCEEARGARSGEHWMLISEAIAGGWGYEVEMHGRFGAASIVAQAGSWEEAFAMSGASSELYDDSSSDDFSASDLLTSHAISDAERVPQI